MRTSCLVLILNLLLVFLASAKAQTFTGAFEGTGRACSGSLVVEAKSISWMTPFSKCRKVAYEVLDQGGGGNKQYYAFQLKQQQRGCLYSVLYLTHEEAANMDINWNVIGYASLKQYEADKQKGFETVPGSSLSCYLVTR